MKPVIACVLLLAVTLSCAPLPELPPLDQADLSPPTLLSVVMRGATTLELAFDEEAIFVEDSLLLSPSLHSAPAVAASGQTLQLRFDPAPQPGVEHSVEAHVADPHGNHLRFLVSFYGVNALLPAMVINEFITQGSGNHPDVVELRVLSDGNLAGACLYEGTPDNWEQRMILPNVSVSAGDYIVVHFKPEGVPEEIDETRHTAQSGGLDATDGAWDFWVAEGSGLSGNNGTISLCDSPGGGIVDAVLYSNRSSDSDEDYRGFGSRDVMERADELVAADAWVAAGSRVAPEDAVDPDPSTSTRSLCRPSTPTDTNTRRDWHVVPTRGATFGLPNSDEVYQP